MIPYRWKVRYLKTNVGNLLWRRWRIMRGDHVGDYARLPEYIRNYVRGNSFVDIGCMWGVNGEYAFVAEEAGATQVKAVDVFGPTPEFEAKHRQRNSKVEFILGDATQPEIIDRIGPVDVVFCAGVLYHLPSPYDLLAVFRKLCRKTLILRTSTIPEIGGLPNMAIHWPWLDERHRRLWNLKSLGLPHQSGISNEFQPDEGYGNWFWGLTPSCLASLLKLAGFETEWRFNEAFAQTFICHPVAPALQHRLPGEDEARELAGRISASGIAKPA